MSKPKSFTLLILLMILTCFLSSALAEEGVFVEKSFGNQRYLYAIPFETKGPFIYSSYPLEIQRAFSAPWDRVWAAAQQVAASKRASILVADQASGLLVFKYDFKPTRTVKDPIIGMVDQKIESTTTMQIYFNVLLKKGDSPQSTIVYATYFIPRMFSPAEYFDVFFFQALERNL
jgi:hypothetical protein